MTTIADIRGRVRKDLGDTTAGAYRWTDDELDRHIERPNAGRRPEIDLPLLSQEGIFPPRRSVCRLGGVAGR